VWSIFVHNVANLCPDQVAEEEDGGSFNILWGKPKKEAAPTISFDHVTFNDVMGNMDAKEELADLVDYLRNPAKYEEMGIKLPKGILLAVRHTHRNKKMNTYMLMYACLNVQTHTQCMHVHIYIHMHVHIHIHTQGPPGTGKTLLARALAGEAEVPFISVNGSSFVQMFAGLGAQRVRKLFARARELSPCIIFIDEIDALGTRRDQPQNYSRQTLNQLLGEMDGFSGTSGVIVVGATNLAHTLDPALVRPGRFDRTVEVTVPDRKVRKQIIQHYLRDKMHQDVDLDLIAANTTGFTGAEIFNLVNRAGIEAVKGGEKLIRNQALIEAHETIVMGRASKDMQVTPQTRKIVAYHEAGHAMVSLYTSGSNPIYKATILPRGQALGFVAHTREDEHLLSKESMMAHLDVCMGGRAAEEIIFGERQITQVTSSTLLIKESHIYNLLHNTFVYDARDLWLDAHTHGYTHTHTHTHTHGYTHRGLPTTSSRPPPWPGTWWPSTA
jgi:ATP-dependent metalloprotease